MKKLTTLPKPETLAEAINGICYLRAWNLGQLALAIGADESWLCKARKHGRGSQKLFERIMACAPDSVRWV